MAKIIELNEWVKGLNQRVRERASERTNACTRATSRWQWHCLTSGFLLVLIVSIQNTMQNCFWHTIVYNELLSLSETAFNTFQRLSFNANESTQLNININLGSYISAECVKWNGFSAFVNRKLIWVKVIRFAILLRKSIWSAGFFRW